jgi:LysM repeat protein
MKMKLSIASIMATLIATAPLLSASEVERLRTLVAEQELQIQQLELKVAQLTNSPAPVSETSTSTVISESAPTVTPESVPTVIATPSSEDGLVPIAETCPEPATSGNPETYTVVAGDHMVSIARKHGTTSAILNELNGLKKGDIIRPGQKLKLPTAATTASIDKPEETPIPVATPVAAPSSNTIEHKVADKETFHSIAKKHNVTVNALIKENPTVNPNTLRIGKIIQIPASAETADLTPVPSPEQSLGQRNIPISSQSASTVSQSRAADKPVKITKEISYEDFAKNYNTTTSRLDQLNGLQLDPTTILAKGSELYIPAQP